MKKLLSILVPALLAVCALADSPQPAAVDKTIPTPPDKAIRQYQDFWKATNPDPLNHVVWKLYVFRAVPPHNMPSTTIEYLIAGLTSYSRKSYYVGLRINQLYNFVRPIPQRGDVIVVSGRLLEHRHAPVALPRGMTDLDYVTMDLDGAVILPEHFDPYATPIPTPGATATPTVSSKPVPVLPNK